MTLEKDLEDAYRREGGWPGNDFIFTSSGKKEAIWGQDAEILWVAGEPLLIAASPGIGKTTIAQQLCLGMIGVRPAELLGYPIRQLADDQRVLYVAADRPAQARRSFRRMVTPKDAVVLGDHLKVWNGPIDISQIRSVAREAKAEVVFIDSLASVAGGDLSQDGPGMVVYHALQDLVASGYEVCVLHHNRKRGGQDATWRGLDEVYGSRWITAVPGSVLYLQGEQGEDTATLRHLKMPLAPVGPIELYHEHANGRTIRYDEKGMPGPTNEEREAIAEVLSPAAEPEPMPPTESIFGKQAQALGVQEYDD